MTAKHEKYEQLIETQQGDDSRLTLFCFWSRLAPLRALSGTMAGDPFLFVHKGCTGPADKIEGLLQ